mgnify:CR=1 FL=1
MKNGNGRKISRRNINLPLSLAILSAIFVFLWLAILVSGGSLSGADSLIVEKAIRLRTPVASEMFLLLTDLGGGFLISVLVGIAAAILAVSDRRRESMHLVLSILGGEITYRIVKLMVHRSRPGAEYALVQADGFAFPSGHAVGSAIFYGIVAFLLWELIRRRWMKIFVTTFFLLLIFLVGFSRLYLGVHWASDVIGGWLLASAFILYFMSNIDNQPKIT